MTKTDVKEVRKAAKEAGATVRIVYGGRVSTLAVEAPDGRTWDASGVHELRADYYVRDGVAGRREAAADVLGRMEFGTSPCEDPDCDWCRPV